MAAGPAEKLKTRIVRTPEAGARRKKEPESRRKENGRLRASANGHYRIDAGNPPNPGASRILPDPGRRAGPSDVKRQPALFDLLTWQPA